MEKRKAKSEKRRAKKEERKVKIVLRDEPVPNF